MLSTDMDAAPPVDLVWTQTAGGEECIGQNDLAAKVQSALGYTALVPQREGPPRNLVVRGSVGRDAAGRGWAAVIEVRRGDAPLLRRDVGLDAPNCRQLDEAIVLVVTLLLDAAASSPPPLTNPLIIVRPTPSISVFVGPDLAVAWGMLPGSFGFGLVSETEIRPLWPIVLSAHYWPASRAIDAGSGGDIGALTFGAATCPVGLARDGWQLFACAGASVGEVNSTGAVDRPSSDVSPYVQIDAQIAFRLRVGRFVVTRLGLGAGIPLISYTYLYKQADGTTLHSFFRTSAVVPVAQLGIELSMARR